MIINYSYSPVIITGCGRSRTSLVAGILHNCGLWMGDICGATPNNKKGMFENVALRSNALKPFLHNLGYDPRGQNPLPNYNIPPIIGADFLNFAKAHKRIIAEQAKQQDFDFTSPWGWKEPKDCLVWECFNEIYPNAKWVIVRRKASGIAESCMRTSFMKAYSSVKGWGTWIEAHEEKFKQMKNAHLHYKEIWTDELIDFSFAKMREIVKWTGLKWDERKVFSFIDPSITKR